MRKIILDLQLACDDLHGIPSKSEFLYWIQYIFYILNKKIELTIRIVDEKESRLLNMYFRGKDFPTNVLSFPFEPPKQIQTSFIGDLVICRNIIEYEAQKQKNSLISQWAYSVIHGALHLIGYNHTTNEEIIYMGNIEKKIMKKLKYMNFKFFN